MPKRITFQEDRKSTICKIYSYHRVKKTLARRLFNIYQIHYRTNKI